MQQSNIGWSKSLKQSKAKPNQLCFWNCTSCKNVCAIITEVSWCVGSVVRDMAAQWWWWLLFWWVGVGNKTQALSVERTIKNVIDISTTWVSQNVSFFKNRDVMTASMIELRGGVKIENRENLGQCPNKGWPPLPTFGTFLNLGHFWKMLTPPPLTKLGHFWISDIFYKGKIAKYCKNNGDWDIFEKYVFKIPRLGHCPKFSRLSILMPPQSQFLSLG